MEPHTCESCTFPSGFQLFMTMWLGSNGAGDGRGCIISWALGRQQNLIMLLFFSCYWDCVTSLLFGKQGLDFIFHSFSIYNYCGQQDVQNLGFSVTGQGMTQTHNSECPIVFLLPTELPTRSCWWAVCILSCLNGSFLKSLFPSHTECRPRGPVKPATHPKLKLWSFLAVVSRTVLLPFLAGLWPFLWQEGGC